MEIRHNSKQTVHQVSSFSTSEPGQIGMVLPVTVLFMAEAAIPPTNRIPAVPPGNKATTYPTMAAIWKAAPSAVSTVLWRLRAAYRVPPSEHR